MKRLVLLAWLLAGCSSASPPDREEFIEKACQAYLPCCSRLGLYSEGAACRDLYESFTAASAYDSGAAERCLDELAKRASAPTFCDDVFTPRTTPSCVTVFAPNGPRLPGETCVEQADCARSPDGPVACTSSGSGADAPRACQVQRTGVSGDSPCVATVFGDAEVPVDTGAPFPPARGYLCLARDGLRCDATTAKCTPLPKLGEACQPAHGCTAGSYCEPSSGACAAQTTTGGACTIDAQCAAGRCASGVCGRGPGGAAAICGG